MTGCGSTQHTSRASRAYIPASVLSRFPGQRCNVPCRTLADLVATSTPLHLPKRYSGANEYGRAPIGTPAPTSAPVTTAPASSTSSDPPQPASTAATTTPETHYDPNKISYTAASCLGTSLCLALDAPVPEHTPIPAALPTVITIHKDRIGEMTYTPNPSMRLPPYQFKECPSSSCTICGRWHERREQRTQRMYEQKRARMTRKYGK